MEQLTTYRAKGKEIGLVFLFKYDLNGNLKLFEISEGELNEKQELWLFNTSHFPSNEYKMKFWQKNDAFTKIFNVEVSPANLSFEAFWIIWGLKVKKELAEKAWKKLTEANIIKCFLNHKPYQDHLNKTGQSKAHLVTWLNQKRYNDEY